MLHQKTANVTGNNRIATIKSVLHWFSMKHLLLHLHYISISSTANQWQKWTMNIFVFPTSFPYIFPISAKNRLPSPIAANPYHSNVESCSTLCSVVLVPMSSSNRRFTLRWFVLLALTSCQHVLAVSTQKIISFLRKLMWTRYWKLKFTKYEYFGLQRVNPSQNLRTTHIRVTSQIVNSAHVRWGPGDFCWIPEVQCSNYLSYFLCTPCKSGTEFSYLISLRKIHKTSLIRLKCSGISCVHRKRGMACRMRVMYTFQGLVQEVSRLLDHKDDGRRHVSAWYIITVVNWISK